MFLKVVKLSWPSLYSYFRCKNMGDPHPFLFSHPLNFLLFSEILKYKVLCKLPYETQWWYIRVWLAAVCPEGCIGFCINRGSWSHSMKRPAYEMWQMPFQLLLGEERQRPSTGSHTDPFPLWQCSVKLPLSFWSLPDSRPPARGVYTDLRL